MKDILEHIQKVQEQMLREHIKANTIIIDKEVAKVNGFYLSPAQNTIAEFPIVFMGLDVSYETDLSAKVGIPCNFVMAEKKKVPPKTPLSEYSTEELLDEIRKRVEGNE